MSNEAPCRYCGHWDAPNDEKTYCLKHYRRTFPDKGCDICELQAQLAELREERKAISEYCWSKAGGSQSVAGDIYRYLNQDEPLLPEEGK